MLAIRMHGRRGDGVRTSCQILADAFARAGAWAQALAAHGSERPGAAVMASLFVDHRPRRVHGDTEPPDHVLVLDAALLGDVSTEVAEGDRVVINTTVEPCGFMPHASRAVAVDAAAIADRAGLGPIVATAVIGAFCGATRLVSLDDLVTAVEQGSPAKKAQNVAVCIEAYLQGGRTP